MQPIRAREVVAAIGDRHDRDRQRVAAPADRAHTVEIGRVAGATCPQAPQFRDPDRQRRHPEEPDV